MKTGKAIPLSMAAVCLAVLSPQFARSQNALATTTNRAADPPVNQASARKEAAQMVPAAVRLLTALDARKIRPGSQFKAVVDDTVHLKDGTELRHGTVLIGTVATDRMQSRGTSRLALNFIEAEPKNGKAIPIHAMIVGVAPPAIGNGFGNYYPPPPSWSPGTWQIDQIDAEHDVDLHSRIVGANSGVFVTSRKDDVKLVAGSQLTLAIAARSGSDAAAKKGGA